jgi:signal transduction histidine kinase
MRWRLLGSFTLIILIALGTVALVTRYTTEQEVQTFLRHGGQAGLENLSNLLEDYYTEQGSWENVNTTFRTGFGRGQGQRSGANASSIDYILADTTGNIVISPVEDQVGDRLSTGVLAQSIPLEVSGTVVGYLLPEGGIPELPENFEQLLIDRVNQATLLAALVSGGIAILLALLLATLILKPVRGLTRAANKMAEGDLSQRVRVQGSGEMAKLGETFNQMAGSLQQAEARRTGMTADIAHELRNPLAIQRAHLEALMDGVYPLNLKNLELIAEQNHQLTRLVEELRTLALADSGVLPLNKRRIDLALMCQETLARFEPQAGAKSIHLSAQCGSGEFMAEGDKERLQQIHDNLMQNAIRYTPKGGIIELTLHRQANLAVFQVHNTGPQMTDEALSHLFERFYRGEKARDRASGGTGLGLAIARKLAEAHGGTLIGENHPEGGVVFKLLLPVL